MHPRSGRPEVTFIRNKRVRASDGTYKLTLALTRNDPPTVELRAVRERDGFATIRHVDGASVGVLSIVSAYAFDKACERMGV